MGGCGTGQGLGGRLCYWLETRWEVMVLAGDLVGDFGIGGGLGGRLCTWFKVRSGWARGWVGG